jgi:hypothetical protein
MNISGKGPKNLINYGLEQSAAKMIKKKAQLFAK